jgi:PAS domain S-box-containing protein
MYRKENILWPEGTPPSDAYCDEEKRLAILAAHGTAALVDDPELQGIVDLAARICDAPLAMVTMVEEGRQLFLTRTGIDARETPRPTSFCAHAMLGTEPMVVRNALDDPRFADNPLVTGEPDIRFYAGHPLISTEGAPLGALCVIDRVPRELGLSPLQRETLSVLAKAVMRRIAQKRLGDDAISAVHRRELYLQNMIDSVPGIAWSANPEGEFDYVNARWRETTGLEPPRTTEEWQTAIHPVDWDASLARFLEAVRTRTLYEDEWRLRLANGEYRWVQSRAVPVVDEEGDARWFGTVIDIDRQKRLSESRDLLANELSHRIKNIFAVVSGLIAVRSRGRPEVEGFAKEITAAIRALGTAHDYVRPFDGRSNDCFQGLLRDLLQPYETGEGRIEISGEDLEIGPRAATPLALIFHELATNSAKYGALAQPGGTVSIAVSHPCEERDELVVSWQESSPRFDENERRSVDEEGFGSRLLRLAIEGQLGGSFTRTFSEDGLDVEITVPAAKIGA